MGQPLASLQRIQTGTVVGPGPSRWRLEGCPECPSTLHVEGTVLMRGWGVGTGNLLNPFKHSVWTLLTALVSPLVDQRLSVLSRHLGFRHLDLLLETSVKKDDCLLSGGDGSSSRSRRGIEKILSVSVVMSLSPFLSAVRRRLTAFGSVSTHRHLGPL